MTRRVRYLPGVGFVLARPRVAESVDAAHSKCAVLGRARSSRAAGIAYGHAPRWLMIVSVAIVLGLTLEATIDKATAAPVRGTVAYCKANARDLAKRACIVRVMWHPLGQSRKALRVAWCESRLDPNARNGQYRGVWQMGSSERTRFGHDGTVEGQTRAAIRYYLISGWSPWECA